MDVAACRWRSEADRIAAQNDNERRERVLAAEAATRADVVALVEPIGSEGRPAPDSREAWRFRVSKVLKGVIGAEIELSVSSRMTVSCARTEAAFFDNMVYPHEIHILYLKNGEVLRIASEDRLRNEGWLPMWREIRIVRKIVEKAR